MNGIERIVAHIEADGQSEIDRILADARAEAERITARCQAEAAAEAAALEEKNRRAAAERKERLLSAARLEERKIRLAARQSAVEAAYARAMEQLCALPEKQYVRLLVNLLEEASVSGAEEVLFSPADRTGAGRKAVERVNAEQGKRLKPGEETRPIRRGFILRDSRTEVNCALETLLRLQRAETVGPVAAILFGEQGGAG